MWSTDDCEMPYHLSFAEVKAQLLKKAEAEAARLGGTVKYDSSVYQVAKCHGVVDLTDDCPYDRYCSELWQWVEDQDVDGPDCQAVAIQLMHQGVWHVQGWVRF